MRLNKDASRVLGGARIRMLAVRSGRMPLVNPAAFYFGSGSLWMTPSRFAVKAVLAPRDPRASRFGGVAREIGRGRAGVAGGYACWRDGAKPVIDPALWEVEHGKVLVAPSSSGGPRPGAGGALVVESHHRYRPSLMVGACIRGTFGPAGSTELIAERYGIEASDLGHPLELHADRVTSWRGFAIASTVPKSARHLRLAEVRGPRE